MKIRPSLIAFVISVTLPGVVDPLAVNAAQKTTLPQIRSFDVETLARLGREINRHDQLAWVATDVLLAAVSTTDLKAEQAGGWVVDAPTAEKALVRFIRKRGEGFEAAYDVAFKKDAMPQLSTPANRELSPFQLAKVRALKTAEHAVFDGKHPWCDGVPNLAVLDDPDGSGFLVYFLRPKPTNNKVPIGGHYRVTVSADGAVAEQVDQLFASCLTLDKGEVPAGSKAAAMVIGHVISDTPLETHVFLSLQEKLPFMVITSDKKTWNVDEGQIALSKSAASDSNRKKTAKPKAR